MSTIILPPRGLTLISGAGTGAAPGERGEARTRADDTRPDAGTVASGSLTSHCWVFHFERGLCPRNRFLGEVSEGAAEAPSDETPQMGPYHRSSRYSDWEPPAAPT